MLLPGPKLCGKPAEDWPGSVLDGGSGACVVRVWHHRCVALLLWAWMWRGLLTKVVGISVAEKVFIISLT